MTADAENPQTPRSDLASKVFVVRNGKKLLRYLGFSRAAGQRPNALRVAVGSKHGTALTLKNASFAGQYQRAVDLIATFHGLAVDDPLRQEMANTAASFLEHYNLRTQAFKFERQGHLRAIDDVAFPKDENVAADPLEASGEHSGPRGPSAMLPTGLVRGITFRLANEKHPAHIHVRLWRGKGFSLGVENVSFAKQYEEAVEAVAASLGMAPDDPIRVQMLESAEAFLKHYGLTTAPLTIPDVVVILKPNP